MEANQRPTGTVTFLISDIEGSTRLVTALGDGWPALLEAHSAIIRDVVTGSGGVVVSTEGDSFFCVFALASDALRASVAIQQRLVALPVPDDSAVRVRIGVHTGVGTLGGADYVGVDVHLAARIGEAGHGGEVLVSDTTRALVSDSLPEGVTLRDLGEHWLRGIDHPVRLHQVLVESLPSDFPPPRTLTAPFRVPEQLTSFIGRKEEVAHVLQVLDEGRLLTLTGPGGTGKTRLAIAAATKAAPRFPDGVFFVPLAGVTDPDLVAPAILSEIGVAESTRTPEERLTDYLADRELLLVLDNFEQVVSAAPLVSRLLAYCPRLRVMVTSRAPLRIYGERELPVEPLTIPDPAGHASIEELESFESVALFAERARAVHPDFRIDTSNSDAVVGIVNTLDGLPLALELAAARVRLLSPRMIQDRLRDRLSLLTGGAHDLPARQQTLHAAIAWSYDLLDLPTQTLMRRLGVFVGGFDLEEVEVVTANESDVLDGLTQLVEQSLLRRHEANALPRFRMLETIRRFALERLDEAGEASDTKERHLEVYLAMAERARPHLLGPEQAVWLDRLEEDHDNFGAALDWAVSQSEVDAADRLLWALWRFWQFRGHLYEGGRRAAVVLALPGADLYNRCRAMEAAGGIAYWRGDLESCRRFYLDALDLARRIDQPALVAEALYNAAFGVALTKTAGEEGVAEGNMYLEEAKELFARLGDRSGVAKTLWGQGTVLWGAPSGTNLEQAIEIFGEAAALYEGLDDVFQYGWCQRMLGRTLLQLGRADEAISPMRTALDVFLQARDSSAVTLIVNDVSLLALRRGHEDRALHLIGAARALRESTGTDLVGIGGNPSEELEQLIESDGERSELLLAEGGRMSWDEVVVYINDTLDQSS